MYILPKTVKKFQQLLGSEHVKTDEASLALNGYDCSPSSHRPDAVLTLTNPSQLPTLLQLLSREKIPFITRAHATNHAGSCAAVQGGVILELNFLRRIHRIDTLHQFAEVDPAVVTGQLQAVLQPLDYFYAPDPASEKVCTLGGNLAQNASGARCMKYGNTADNTLQADFLLPSGQSLVLRHDNAGPDWLGVIAGSEGTLGIVQKMRVKILPCPPYIYTFLVSFSSLAESIETVTDLVRHGLIPRCIEAMDGHTLRAIEQATPSGYPLAEAVLIIEVDGTLRQVQTAQRTLDTLCHRHHCLSFKMAQTDAEREKLWKGRRAAYSAMTALAPNIAVGDGTVPRSELPRALAQVQQIITDYGVKACLLFHAGDGNFHPQLVFDARSPEQTRQAKKALQAILKTCVDCGGTISGEHGIGVEKRALMAYQYSQQTLQLFQKIKNAFDPYHLANPSKILPVNFEEKALSKQPTRPEVMALQQDVIQRFQRKQKSSITGGPSTDSTSLSTSSLSHIIEIDTVNYTATIQAGVAVDSIVKTLAGHQLYAKLPTGFTGTLGALVATKAAPEFISQITGIEALLANGDFISYGGKVMKNAAGYNIGRLLAGSWGALGIITQLTFKIYASACQTEALAPQTPHADELFRAVKKEIDPDGLFLSPAFSTEGA
ncbi:MAG: FAD-binding protein [Elusimicrobiaceae bacterium]|nr:FAD-binding protein [Elusimicrobiaceae bacterium]